MIPAWLTLVEVDGDEWAIGLEWGIEDQDYSLQIGSLPDGCGGWPKREAIEIATKAAKANGCEFTPGRTSENSDGV